MIKKPNRKRRGPGVVVHRLLKRLSRKWRIPMSEMYKADHHIMIGQQVEYALDVMRMAPLEKGWTPEAEANWRDTMLGGGA